MSDTRVISVLCGQTCGDIGRAEYGRWAAVITALSLSIVQSAQPRRVCATATGPCTLARSRSPSGASAWGGVSPEQSRAQRAHPRPRPLCRLYLHVPRAPTWPLPPTHLEVLAPAETAAARDRYSIVLYIHVISLPPPSAHSLVHMDALGSHHRRGPPPTPPQSQRAENHRRGPSFRSPGYMHPHNVGTL